MKLGLGALLTGVVALGAGACATAPRPAPDLPAPPRSASLDEVLGAYDAYCRGIATLSASGDVDVRDFRARRAHKLGVRVVATRGGRLYLKGSVAVITALEVVADGERFWFQVPSKKTVWTGQAGQAADREAGTEVAPYYALRPADVTAALLPEPLAPSDEDVVVMDAEPRLFALTLARADGGRALARRRVWLDRETLRPQRVRSYDADAELVSEVALGDWANGLPRWVQVQRPTEGYQASFSFSKVESNVVVPERAFVPRLAEGYKVVEVR